MNSKSLSFWDQAQLLLLRLLSLVLALVDSLLHVRWGARLLDRLTSRWQVQLAELDDALARLEQERQQMQSLAEVLAIQAEALSIQAAVIYLARRRRTHDELRFDPAIPHDEETLDAIIDLLVKARLATVETQEIEPEHYIYHLEPDWPAIRQRLADAADQATPEFAEWFYEGIQFIDEALDSCSPATNP